MACIYNLECTHNLVDMVFHFGGVDCRFCTECTLYGNYFSVVSHFEKGLLWKQKGCMDFDFLLDELGVLSPQLGFELVVA